jgi:hypothetical protein
LIPRCIVITCPRCDSFVELDVAGFSVCSGEHEDRGVGIAVEIAAFAPHNCGGRK